MRTQILLAVLTALVEANWYWGGCPDVDVIQDFDASKYMGTWWVPRQVKNLPYDANTRCVTANYTLNSDGSINVLNSGLDEETGEYESGAAKAYCEDGTSKCKVVFRPFISGDYEVLETDYDNYAYIWSCDSYFFFHAEYGYYLARGSS